mgnify:CR=1 FL=1
MVGCWVVGCRVIWWLVQILEGRGCRVVGCKVVGCRVVGCRVVGCRVIWWLLQILAGRGWRVVGCRAGEGLEEEGETRRSRNEWKRH